MGLMSSSFASFTDDRKILDDKWEGNLQEMAAADQAMSKLWGTYQQRVQKLHASWSASRANVEKLAASGKIAEADLPERLKKVSGLYEDQLTSFIRNVRGMVDPQWKVFSTSSKKKKAPETSTKTEKAEPKAEKKEEKPAGKVTAPKPPPSLAALHQMIQEILKYVQEYKDVEKQYQDMMTRATKQTWTPLADKYEQWKKMDPEKRAADAGKWQMPLRKTVTQMEEGFEACADAGKQLDGRRDSFTDELNSALGAALKHVQKTDVEWQETMSGPAGPANQKQYQNYVGKFRPELMKARAELVKNINLLTQTSQARTVTAGKAFGKYREMIGEIRADLAGMSKLKFEG